MDDRTAPAGRYPRDIGLGAVRHDWTRQEVRALFELPFPELIFRAQTIHRRHFDPNEVQISTLLSIKTGGCPEDCAYCPQSVHYDTGVKAEKLMAVDAVLAEARAAKSAGASRFCMGAAWREPKDRDLDKVCEMVAGVKAARARDLCDPRHAHRRAGATSQGGRARLLQPQPRHLAGLLRRDHHHAHLRGAPPHPGSRARRPAFTSAAAASWAWERAPRIAWA